ncbi:hypothetical protein [Pseudomonas aeruginosa]|uniref:hypothetical protein n=1 Tax=Pseudomonas aeruginosa TaxID=287 RepID=UPI0003B95508|nr:hypothetical protein [Pseudomonas aeruginosa]ERU34960.1 hypothetical protein Q093_04215 [Pseudomonas aeruginosa CF614]MBG4389392.1 hypothetical protein [Pseudomonas aeruginosa]MBG5368193.1 hypothetical protein [Pseudomonas aeruginosa]MBG5642291.1 hypothetical protein [Pseudomonas aeruginosa]MBG6802831.1 hypothetical protein [Pseudomonas aeruginosa]
MSNELTDVRCHCGAEFPADSYDAGFIAGSGMCQNCDAAMPPKDIPALVDQAGGDERAAFEAAFAAMGRPVCRADYDQDAYGTPFDDGGWTGWQARAALAQPYPKSGDYSDQSWINAGCPPEQPEQAEAERPEVVGYLGRRIGMSEPGFHRSAEDAGYPGPGRKALIDLEQHDRIVGALRADRDSWAEQAEQRLADWDEMRKERDAALARVAELEGKLTDWVHEGFRLNEALAVAKAQHSVPDDDMILQIFADNAEHSEQGDEHGYCIVREQHAQAIARKLLAAAPGKEGV